MPYMKTRTPKATERSNLYTPGSSRRGLCVLRKLQNKSSDESKLNPLWCRAKSEMMGYSVNWLRHGCLILRANPSQWNISKVLALAQTILTIQLTLPQNKQTISRTMLMKRHQRIAPLFEEEFWGTQWRSQDIDPLRGILSIFVSRKQSDYAKRREILIRLP